MPKETSKTNRSAKTNKTSHVLTLLTNDGEAVEELTPTSESEAAAPETDALAPDPEATASEAEALAPETETPAPKTRGRKPGRPRKKKTESQTDEQAAAEIQNALEDALKAESAETPPENAEAPAPVRDSSPEPVSEPAPQADAAVPAGLPHDMSFDPGSPEGEAYGPDTALSETLDEDAPALETSSDDEEAFCFNIMEALVESKIEKYIELYGLCSCPRCRADVIALALTSLPSKYVVATRTDLVPLLSVYQEKYNAAVVSQVMRACNRVADRPRHKRS